MIPYWLTFGWKFIFEPMAEDVHWWTVIRCRWKGHPYSVVWFNPSGLEPDMICTNCGDDLG